MRVSRFRFRFQPAAPQPVVHECVLTPQEHRNLRLMAQGLTWREAADELGCSPESVKTYRSFVRLRLGARNGCHAVALGYERGLLP